MPCSPFEAINSAMGGKLATGDQRVVPPPPSPPSEGPFPALPPASGHSVRAREGKPQPIIIILSYLALLSRTTFTMGWRVAGNPLKIFLAPDPRLESFQAIREYIEG